MNTGDLCICGHTREIHFGHDCSYGTRCQCKQFVLCDLAVPMFEALKALEEQVADLRAGRTWSRDYVEFKEAHLRAKALIQKAKEL